MKRIEAFHGSNQRIRRFEANQNRNLDGSIYGSGIAYFTTSIDLAKIIASADYKKFGGGKFVYRVSVSFKKIFDSQKYFSGNELIEIINRVDLDKFARGSGILTSSTNRNQIINDLKIGIVRLNGEQVFRGLSDNLLRTDSAREILSRLGYDGIRYIDGANEIYIAYDPISINIRNRYIVSDTYVSSSETRDVYTFI